MLVVVARHTVGGGGGGGGGGNSLTFEKGVLNVLIWGLNIEVGEIIWGLKFRRPKFAFSCLKFGVGEIIRGQLFIVCHCPSHFLSIKFFSKLDS